MACSLCHLSHFLLFLQNVVSAQDEFIMLFDYSSIWDSVLISAYIDCLIRETQYTTQEINQVVTLCHCLVGERLQSGPCLR